MLRYQHAPVVDLNHAGTKGLAPSEQTPYRRVKAYGRFLTDHVVYLENRYHKAQAGFHVLMVFAIRDGGEVLVNRGWLARDPARREAITAFKSDDESFLLEGIMQSGAGRTLKLSHDDETGQTIRQNLEVTAYGQERGLRLPSFVIAQTGNTADGLVREWQVSSNDVAKHYGYMVQWWGMAAAILMAGVIAAVRVQRKVP